MGLIVDMRDAWSCRDCGSIITDAATLQRLEAALTPIEPLVEDAAISAVVTVPAACAACGGGRVVFRVGKMGTAVLP